MTSDDEPITGEIVPTDDGTDPADPLEGLLGGGLDLGAMMQMASDVQHQVAAAQEQLASSEVEGTAGGGAVSVTLNGHLHLLSLRISPSAVDPDDLSMLEDLVRAAWQDAHDQVARLQAQADPLGGLGTLFGGG